MQNIKITLETELQHTGSKINLRLTPHHAPHQDCEISRIRE